MGFEIRSERLLLTPLGLRFLQSTNAYALDDENTKYMCCLPNDSAEETEAFLRAVEAEWAKAQPNAYEFAILYRGAHVGGVGVYLEDGVGELGWIVNKRYWGNGFACEAAEALIRYLSSQLGVTRFVAHCDAENVASYKTMEKLGMMRTGEYGGRRNRSATRESTEYRYELSL